MKYIKAQKKYGQNFLKNQDVLQSIATTVEVESQDLIIEIGPGMGALTDYLYSKNSFLLCYEIDERMKEYLNKFETEKTHVIYDDFLKHDVVIDSKAFSYNNLYVVANIPYYITSPIISKLIEMEVKPKTIVLLVQKEFAERIVAKEKNRDYNAFTLYVDLEYEASLVSYVNRNCFVPVPNVDSAVIKLVKKENSGVVNKNFYLKFIKSAFQNKRKTLKNNLKQYDWEKIKVILNGLGYEENVRAEKISKKDFKELVNKYEER